MDFINSVTVLIDDLSPLESVTILLSSMETVYIPLGSDCCVAWNLTRMGLRKFSFPFDWMRFTGIKRITDLIENKFQFFLDPEYLQIERESDKYPIIMDDWHDNPTNHIIVKNVKTGIKFFHDFNTMDDLPEVQVKYNRRISRLYQILEDDSVEKVFVRYTVPKKAAREKVELEKFFADMGYKNVRVVTVTNNRDLKCSSWKKEELDWIQIIT